MVLIPPSPAFQTDSERQVWNQLVKTLEPGEVLFHGLRFTDPKDGDVEIDLLLLSPSRGAALIEVKGGLVQFQDGQWTLTTNGGASRRIHPVDQARRAKHALRRYLDRSPGWDHGLLRSQWFLAFPHTPVDGNLGPQAPRDRVIAQGDLSRVREIIEEGLLTAPKEPAVPDSDWVTLAVELIQNAPDASHSADRFSRAHVVGGHGFVAALALIGLGLATLATALLAVAYGGPLGLVLAVAGVILAVLIGYRVTRRRARIPLWVAFCVIAASVLAGGAAGLGLRQSVTPQEKPVAMTPATQEVVESAGFDVTGLPCSSAYSPCVKEVPWNRNCDDIGFRVSLTGKDDPYGLDRDGDGQGCSAFPYSANGEGVASVP